MIDLYIINLKSGLGRTCLYGRNTYDYQEGTMVFMAPNQTIKVDSSIETPNLSENWILLFHPDLIRKSELGNKIEQYSFFNYDVHEALHISDYEKNLLNQIINNIENEYSQNIDTHSQELIISNIKMILDYCTRFYDRQFYTRTNFNKDIVAKFNAELKTYYSSQLPLEIGIPTVKYLGEKMNISPYYLSDLLKKETGRNTIEHVHFYIIDKAKTNLLNSTKSISEIAYELGFEYPQHFAKLFKNKTGLSPTEYRSLN
ncbi:helix-turn-helix domain-containing protein [Tenacibaculum sp. FZY0031]|uniref:helix-turn-helix domain-containing protein n=1 Tax=Tenacibaculum sp. FZY0031 TaxID=3116648 RepID=UPI002EC1A75C|nr:helix-turn-helix domain-containing protein [Tenacibaculum sp. FZY0031]